MSCECYTNVTQMLRNLQTVKRKLNDIHSMHRRFENTTREATRRADGSRRLLSDGSADWNCSEGEGMDGQ